MQRSIVICQNCGSALRDANSKCSGCGSIVTEHSATPAVQIQAAETGSISRPNDPAVVLENMFSHFKQERRTHERQAEQRDHQECGQDARDPGASLSQEKADRVEPPNLNADRVEPPKRNADFFEQAPVNANFFAQAFEQSPVSVTPSTGADGNPPTAGDSPVAPSLEEADKVSNALISENTAKAPKRRLGQFVVVLACGLICTSGMFGIIFCCLLNTIETKKQCAEAPTETTTPATPSTPSTPSNPSTPFTPSTPSAIAAKKIPQTLNGDFTYTYSNTNGTKSTGRFSLAQTDRFITGNGTDFDGKQTRNFKLDGVYNAPRLTVYKRYFKVGGALGNAIAYSGIARFDGAHDCVINGSWRFDGSSTALKTYNQTWSARGQAAAPEQTQKKQEASIFWSLIQILGGCILFGLTLLLVSLKLFGMNGYFNTQERKKYIPHSSMPQHKKLLNELSRGKQRGSLELGERNDCSPTQLMLSRTLYLPALRRQRHPHLLALGGASKGKSRLMASMIIDDIKNNDRAVVVIDSEGSVVEQVLRWLCSSSDAQKYLHRVLVIDPVHGTELSYNPLLLERTEPLQTAANSVVMAFKAVCTESQNQQNQWTEQTSGILRHALLLLILNGHNLSELPRLLSDNDFRDILLQHVEQMGVEWKPLLEAWSNYKKQARTEQWLQLIEPILNRVQPLLSDARAARMLNSRDCSIDFEEIIAEKKILLVTVPEGQLEKAGNLLGSLIIGGVRQASLNQYERTREAARPCSLYMDRLNNFMGADAFESICTDFRKISISIHATLKSLQDISEDYRNRVLVNFGAMAMFSLSKKDADLLGPGMFKVDGRKVRKWNIRDMFGIVNSSPTMDLASDEEKINVNRLVGLPERCYFLHLVGEEGGVFNLRAPEFKDIARGDVNWDLMESLMESVREEDEDI